MTIDEYSSRMNTILEIHNNRSKTGRKEGSLPHTRKVNPIPPIHYTWNRRLETFKMNTILEIRNPKRAHVADWAQDAMHRTNENTLDTLKKVIKMKCKCLIMLYSIVITLFTPHLNQLFHLYIFR